MFKEQVRIWIFTADVHYAHFVTLDTKGTKKMIEMMVVTENRELTIIFLRVSTFVLSFCFACGLWYLGTSVIKINSHQATTNPVTACNRRTVSFVPMG